MQRNRHRIKQIVRASQEKREPVRVRFRACVLAHVSAHMSQGSETQLKVCENLNYLIQRFKGKYISHHEQILYA